MVTVPPSGRLTFAPCRWSVSPGAAAWACSVLALVAPSSVVALATYAGAQRVDWSLGLPLAIGGLFTVSAGVALAHKLPEKRMRAAFAWMLAATALWLFIGSLIRA